MQIYPFSICTNRSQFLLNVVSIIEGPRLISWSGCHQKYDDNRNRPRSQSTRGVVFKVWQWITTLILFEESLHLLIKNWLSLQPVCNWKQIFIHPEFDYFQSRFQTIFQITWFLKLGCEWTLLHVLIQWFSINAECPILICLLEVDFRCNPWHTSPRIHPSIVQAVIVSKIPGRFWKTSSYNSPIPLHRWKNSVWEKLDLLIEKF